MINNQLGKTMLAAALALITAGAQAQNATTSTTTATSAAPAAGTTTAPATEFKATMPWSATLILDGGTGAGDQNEKGSNNAKVEFYNSLRLGYKINDKYSVRLDHNFETSSVPLSEERSQGVEDRIGAIPEYKNVNGYGLMDPALAFSQNTGSVLGSNPIVITHRYFIPVTEMNRVGPWKDNNKLGIYRLSTEIGWDINPKWTVSYSLDPRINFSQAQAAMSFRHYGNLYYNVTGAIQPYLFGGIHRGIGGLSTAAPNLWQDLSAGRASSENGYVGYGVNISPAKWVDLTAGYETLWSLGSRSDGAAEPFLLDNSSYTFTAVFKM